MEGSDSEFAITKNIANLHQDRTKGRPNRLASSLEGYKLGFKEVSRNLY